LESSLPAPDRRKVDLEGRSYGIFQKALQRRNVVAAVGTADVNTPDGTSTSSTRYERVIARRVAVADNDSTAAGRDLGAPGGPTFEPGRFGMKAIVAAIVVSVIVTAGATAGSRR
jgi:hypothetical protein